jgi:hypothetical protein
LSSFDELPSDTVSPIFIGGHHRSGTTLLRVTLNRHPHIACGPEGQLLERTSFLEFHRWFEETWLPRLERYGFTAAEIDRAMAAFIDAFFTRHQIHKAKRRWAEKTPKNILRIDYLLRLFPRAQFIHVIRDPRDIHCSVVEKAEAGTPQWRSITPEDTARDWTRRIRCGLRWRHDVKRYREVRYEDLVQDPACAMRDLLSFLGEPWDDQVIAGNELPPDDRIPAVARPVFSTSVGRWHRDLAADDLQQIEDIAGPLMGELGYELSTVPSARRPGREIG